MVLSADISTDEERTVKTELIEQTIKDGASINNALQNIRPSLNTLQFLAQNYYNKIGKDLFLSMVLSADTSTGEDKKRQRELFVKTLDAGGTITKLNIKSYDSTSPVELILEHKDKIINKHNANMILEAFLDFLSSQDAVDPKIEEASIAMITEYNIPIPLKIIELPFSSLQKFMQLPQYY